MTTITKFYGRAITATLANMPSGALGTWDYTNTSIKGASARSLLAAASGSSNALGSTGTVSSTATPKTYLGQQLLSEPLAAQTIGSGNWVVAFRGQYSGGSALRTWEGWAGLYLVNGSTGAVRSTIFTQQTIGSTGRTVTTARTCYATTISGSSVSVTAGDYLCLECGIKIASTTTSASATTNTNVQGTNDITADNSSSATDIRMYITAPAAITMQDIIVASAVNGSVAPSTGHTIVILTQFISATAYDGSVAVPTGSTVAQSGLTIAATAIDGSTAPGTPKLDHIVHTTGVDGSTTPGTPQMRQAVAPVAYDGASTPGNGIIVPGMVDIQGQSYDGSTTPPSPLVLPGAVDVVALALPSDEDFGYAQIVGGGTSGPTLGYRQPR